MAYFYDTCALLNEQENLFTRDKEKFYISIVSIQELENIKTSGSKDEDTKWKARNLVRLLNQYEDKYTVINYDPAWDEQLIKDKIQPNNDARIIYTASTIEGVTFVTDDLTCKILSKKYNLKTVTLENNSDDYTGYTEKNLNEAELAKFYNYVYSNINIYGLLENQYLIIKLNGQVVSKYKWLDNKYVEIFKPKFESRFFGKLSGQDAYQDLALDSLSSNKITVLRGKAGSGKSYLGLGYLMTLLEKGSIDRIIIFCNTVATKDSCKLGFYPGSKDEKLLDSQIGNFLLGKLGDEFEVEKLVHDGKIMLVPVADCRGMDTTGMNAGVYFTEAQNATIDMMKLMLQRIGEDSICVVEGDDKAQVDMTVYNGRNNGLRRLSEVFRGENYYGEITLQQCHRSRIAEHAELM